MFFSRLKPLGRLTEIQKELSIAVQDVRDTVIPLQTEAAEEPQRWAAAAWLGAALTPLSGFQP